MILTATSTDGTAGSLQYRATGGDFTIGRGADCDWTLPDPTRQLSKRHCSMTAVNAAWRITDLSSNGMTLNGRALAPGVSHPLQHGDRLGLGSYEIAVSLAEMGAATGVAPAFDEAEPFGDGRQGGRMIGDPFVSPGAEAIVDPFDIALPPLFEEGPERQPSGPVGGSAGDDVSALRQSFEPPRPGHLLLPPDWDEPLHPDPAPPPAAPDRVGGIARVEPLPADPPSAPSSDPGQPPPPPPQPAPAPPDAMARSELDHDTADLPRPDASSPSAAPASAAAPADNAAARAFAAFARGAGLEGLPLEPPEQALEQLGRAFRAYVVGLRRLLIARATVKGEFRIDRTMIRPFGNNPIKFATDDKDAMAALLGIGRQVGMTAEQAVADSIRDVRSHELALNEAFQHAIRELMEEISPDRVAAELQPGPFDAIPVLRNNRRWRMFEQRHGRLRASLENSMDSVFGQAFARGYEAALARVSEPDPDEVPLRSGHAP